MICPKYKAGLLTLPNAFERIDRGEAECDKLKCGQWDVEYERCAILTISQLKVSGKVNTHTI